MALTWTETSRNVEGNRIKIDGTLLLSSSYPTGGESLPLATIGLVKLVAAKLTNGNGYIPQWDFTNSKAKMYTSAATETTNATDLSAITLRCTFEGT